jgi:ATP-dependent DNA helicase DinG
VIYFDKQSNKIDVAAFLSDKGPLADSFGNFETRPEQIEMAKAVDNALEKKHHLVVEAGTGVGKSFAYLVPAIKQVVENKVKVIISTYTINLQEQLINKDIPFLANCTGFDFEATLAKGRGNYLCIRRLEYSLNKYAGLFDEFGQMLIDISKWAKETSDGSLSSLGFAPPSQVWDMVQSEHGNCKGRKCPHYKNCFYWKARRRLEKSDIIVANHALLFSDLILKENSPAGVLPDYEYLIIDEAHNIEPVAEEHFGINVSSFAFSFILNNLYNPKSRRGLLTLTGNNDIVENVKDCQDAVKVFFRQIQAWFDNTNSGDNLTKKCPANFVDDNITTPLKNLRAKINEVLKADKKEEDEDDSDDSFELQRAYERLRDIENEIKQFLSQSIEEQVYWVECSSNKKNYRLRSAPVKAADDIKRVLFDKFASIIMTSATLNCGNKDQQHGFEFFTSRIGLGEHKTLCLGSPYDYAKQVSLYIEKNMPEPSSKEFTIAAVEKIKKYILMTGGKAFVLFTSYSMLQQTANLMQNWFSENNILLLQQGKEIDRTTLLKIFKEDTNSVLFGTDSFWQGVDVPGDSLSNVIIVKLPFAVPNHPLIEGKIEQIRKDGGNPFFDFQLPAAVIKFKQGFGRLIRSSSDTGIVAVLDSRMVTKKYGQMFLEAIPKCKMC